MRQIGRIGLIGLMAAAVAAAGPDELLRLRTPDNPRPLPERLKPPPKHRHANRQRQGARGEPLCLDSVIRDDFVCNDDVTGGCEQRAPKLAVDAAGNFVASWYEFRDGDADAWFQRFDSAGTRSGTNGRLNTDVSMGWQGDPSSAMNRQGQFLFCWEDRRDIGNSDLFCQRFDSAGTRLGDNFRVSDSAAAGDQSMSGAWVGSTGVALLAWDDRRNGLTGDIYAQFYDAGGQAMGANFRVNDDPVGMANQYEPDVSGDDSGRFVVAWMDGRGQGGSDWNVFCQRFDSLGRRLGVNVQVTTDNLIQWAPDVGCGRGGGFVVTWDDERNGNWDVYAQLYDAQGNAVGQNFRVNDDAGNTDQYSTGAAVNRFGEFIIVWTDRRSGEDDAYARLYDAAGSPRGPGFVLSDVSTGRQVNPAVEPRPDGGYWVAWSDARSGNFDIYGRRLDRDGNEVGPDFRVNDDAASSLQRCSSIGMDARGRICIGWEDERGGTTDIYRVLLDSTGQVLGPNLRLNDDSPGGAMQFYCGVAAGNGKFFAAWTDCRMGPESTDIYGQFLDSLGQLAGSNLKVNSNSNPALQWYPYCAMDSANNAAVVWMDTRQGRYQYFCRRYDPQGNPMGPEFLMQDTAAEAYYGSVAMNRTGRFVAAWMDYRSGQADAYCQAFRADGSRIGPNIKANTDPPGNYHGYPACAIDEQGRFVVAWEDTRNDRYDVYLQWFDSSGTGLGDNERVNDEIGPDGASYSPSCAFGPDGRLAVQFNDERNPVGNPQIYCQRFRPDRTRVSHNQIVNNPDTFPNCHHWTVAQSIAASDRVVAFAWTDNRRHQGFDIFAKLTDWDLVGLAERGLTDTHRPGAWPGVVRRETRMSLAGVPRGSTAALFDVAGRQVLSGLLPGGVLELEGISPGAYFLVVRQGRSWQCHKVVVE